MSTELKIPALGESITEVQIGEWRKSENETVADGEEVVTIDSEKASVDLPAPAAGKLVRILKQRGETAKVGETIAVIEEGSGAGDSEKSKNPEQKLPNGHEAEEKEPAKEPASEGEKQGKPEESKEHTKVKSSGPPDGGTPNEVRPAKEAPKVHGPDEGREEELVPMSPLRKAAARRLVEAQHQAALLTTFNEADMSAVMALRKEHGEAFQKKHGCRLGFMSFFVKASIEALKTVPQINAEVRGEAVLFRNYFDIGVAISSGRGLVVPVLRNAERMSFAEIETTIAQLAQRADAGKLMPSDLAGGTFTISNGGVFGSLLSTPIVNPPQSGVLGMHAIQERPVAVAGQVVIRPMMYLALTYDHRVVDGREAVTFLKRITEVIQNPARMLLEI